MTVLSVLVLAGVLLWVLRVLDTPNPRRHADVDTLAREKRHELRSRQPGGGRPLV